MACCFVYVRYFWFGLCSSPAVSAVTQHSQRGTLVLHYFMLPEDDPIEGLKHVGDILNLF